MMIYKYNQQTTESVFSAITQLLKRSTDRLLIASLGHLVATCCIRT